MAYDRGPLVTDFAKLLDECYESDPGMYTYESRYDSYTSFGFEAKLRSQASSGTADGLAKDAATTTPSAVDSESNQTDSEDLALAIASDYDSDTPPTWRTC